MIKSSLKCAGSNDSGSNCLRPKRLYAAVLLALCGPVYALPEGGEVVAGEATIDVSGDTMQVLQSSQRAILNFQSFDIDSGQTVNFHQPGVDAVALNRVLGDRLSEIHGALNANGQVYLINPNGVVFGNGAEINVGSLVVTTLDMADQDFLAGRDAFSGDGIGRVENQGSINAQDRVVLLAPEVVNRGDIEVPDGEIVMRSSRQALLHTAGSEIPILVDDPSLVGQVTNEGSMHAGEIALVLDGSGRQAVYDAAINNSGLVRAVRGTGEGGEIHLFAATGVVNSGSLNASAEQGAGGTVSINAQTINQSGAIRATAAGEGGGGQVELLADNAIAMHSGSTIDASADSAGDAGDVVVIAEKSTWFTEDAEIKARGGQTSGDGGFVEVSGHEFVSVEGEVDVGADNGEGGLWFIDPTDISILPDGLGADSNGTFTGTNPANWTPTGSPNTASINVVTLRNTLMNNGNVRISTASGGTAQGNITFAAGLNYDGLGGLRTLTLEANGSIIFEPGSFISDSSPGTVEGLNFNATAGTGFVLPDTASIFAHTGKINITVLTGDATFTGLGSASNAVDAIRVTANAGRLINAGASTWNLTVPTAGAGVILSARDGIGDATNPITIGNGLSANGSFVDAVSSAGDVYVRGEALLRINNLSSAGDASVHAGGELWLTDSSVLSGDHIQLSSSSFVALPQSGLTVPGALTLLGPDIVTHNAGVPGGRTLTLGATDLVINTNAAGGNLQINSTASSLDLTNSFSNTVTVTETNGLVLSNLNTAGSVFVTTGGSGNLQIGNIRLGGNGLTLDFDAGGSLTYTGALTSAAGANNTTFNFASGTALNLNGALRDSASSAGAHNFNFSAGTDFVMGSTASVAAWGGQILIEALAGDAAITGLSTSSTAQDAVQVRALNGAITEADALRKDIDVPGGGFLLHAMGDIGDLQVESNFFNTVSTTGNITFHEEASTSALRLEAPGTVSVYTGLQFSIDLAAPLAVNNLFVDAGTDFRIADAGVTVDGDLTVVANTIRGGAGTVGSGTVATPLIMAAANADITLRNGNLARTWTTSFDQLALNISGGTGAFALTDSDGLTLNAVTTGGNTRFTTTNANLALTAAPTVAGDLTLITNGSGDVVIPNGGMVHTGNLTLTADNLRDSNAGSLTIGATNANITLRDGSGTQSWATSFTQLALDIAGAGDFSLVDTDGLTLNTVATNGNVGFSTTGANLVLTSAPIVGGNLSLVTQGSGDVVIPDAGLAYTGDLTVVADNLVDSNSTLTLAAANADITLRDGATARNWTTSFDQLALNISGGSGSFALTDSDGLTLSSVTTGGNASFTTTDADLILTAAPAVSGNLTLSTSGSGDVVIPDAGLTHTGNLTLTADNLRGIDSSLTLGAANADITLRDGSTAQSWVTSFSQLTLDIAGAGPFSLVDGDGLTLNTVTTGGSASFSATGADLILVSEPVVGGDLSLATVGSGDVVIPNTGLAYTGDLTILADNLLDSDSTLTLAAANADITLRDGAGTQTWATSFDQLAVDIAGGDFSLIDADGLTITALSTGGNASFSTTGADLILTSAPTVAGDLALTTITSGDVIIPNAGVTVAGDLTIMADNLRDADADLVLGAVNADITLRDGATAQSWVTSFDALVLDIAGTGAFALDDTDGITLSSATTGGSASFSTNAADLVLDTAPTVGGDLSLATIGSGDLIIPETGLLYSGDLTVVADSINDSDTNIILAAANADITLRAGSPASSWSTSFASLVLDLTGVDDFLLTDTDGLTITSATSTGNATFRTTAADLVLAASPTVGGELGLTTLGSGDLVIADTGLSHSGDLTVLADNLVDSDTAITVGAANANITLRGGDAAQSWTTSFDSLVLDIAGTGEFLLTDTDGITLDSIATGGNANFRATAADLMLTADPTVAGDLELSTVGSGDVVIADAGLSHAGDLTVLADNVVDSDSSVTLSATNANITLRGGDSAQSWSTNFDSLVLDIAGGGDFLLTDSDGLTLTSAATGGNATFRTTDADLLVTSPLSIAGELGLSTQGSGDVVIPEAGLAHSGDLTIVADNLIDSDENVTLAAANADITLRAGPVAHAWNTSFDSLALDLAGTGDFLLTDTDGLTLTSVSTGGNATFRTTAADLVLTSSPVAAGELTLTTQTSGDLVLADAGLLHSGDLVITADDVRDSDTTVTLGGTNATITLRGGDAAQTWNTSFDALVLDIAGSGDFTLIDSDALTLTSVATGGNAGFTATGGDLTLTAAPSVAGDLNLSTLGSGDVVIPTAGLSHGGDLTIDADNLHDTNSTVSLAAANAAITLREAAAAQTWNTSFDALVLDLAGTGAFSLIDTDGLTLTSVTTGGAASFTATAADLVLASSPVVAGALSLTTEGSGDLVIPQTGLLHSGNLTVVADAISDGDSAITLAGTNADIRLRGGETAQSWATSFNTLVLDIAGGGDFALTDSDGLTLTSVATGANASFTTTGVDLVLAESPLVAGDLTLATQGGGDVIVPNTGLAHNGTLVLTADSVRDSDTAVTVTATDLIATLVDQQLAATWNTTVERLEMSVVGGGALTLNNSGSLLLDNLISDGVVDLSSAGDLQVDNVTGAADVALTSGGTLSLLNSNYDLDGELSLTATDLQLAADGLTVTDTMRLQAETLSAAGGGPLVLAGSSADLTLTGDQALALTTRLSQLGLTYSANNSLTLSNDRSLVLERFEIPNVTTLGLTVNGTLTMPETGLAASERINIDAVDLLDSDRDLTFAAPELAVRLSGTSGDHSWDVTTDSLDVLFRGQANLQLNATDGLVLQDLNGDAQAISIENGNFGVNLTSGDLLVAGNVSTADLADDEIRTGVIDMNIGEGSLLTSGPVAITSTNLVDQDVGESGAAYGISVRLTDTAEANRNITLGDGTNAATLRAVGGDILLDTRAPGTAAAAERNVMRNSGSTIDIFNNPGDARTGQVLRNGNAIAAESWQTVRAGRILAIVTDVAATPPGNVLDDIDDLDGSTDIVRDVDKSGPKAAVQFEQVFGTCDELDKKNRHRCRVDDALKSFLSHWLVGGEMPPKTEIR